MCVLWMWMQPGSRCSRSSVDRAVSERVGSGRGGLESTKLEHAANGGLSDGFLKEAMTK